MKLLELERRFSRLVDLKVLQRDIFAKTPRDIVEAAAHELAHAVVLRVTLHAQNPRNRDRVSARLDSDSVTRAYADHQEIMACAVELDGLAALEFRVNARWLAEFAAENMRTEFFSSYGTRVFKATAALRGTPAILWHTRRFVRVVEGIKL